jgi:hypothetical protein
MVRRHWVARWLQLAIPAMTAVAAAGAVALLVARSMGLPLERVSFSTAGALVLAAMGAALLSGKRLNLSKALVCLEERGRLHNRLSAAHAGIGPWPKPAPIADGLRWNVSRLLLPPLCAIALLAAGRWAPLPPDAMPRPREEPMSWAQVDSWLQTLEQARIAEPEALEKIEARLEELRNQPPEKWYEQSSLEAGDTLREQTAGALKELQEKLHEAEQVAAADQERAGLRKDDLQKLGAAWEQALSGLQSGDLPVDKELLEQAKRFQPGEARQLSPEAMAALRERLAEGARICEQCVGPKRPGGGEETGGPGGEGGGGETAPLSWMKTPTELQGRQKEKLESDDLSRALPAETLAVTTAEHEVKKDPAREMAGGEIASPGAGGAAVWQQAMVPEERQVLQRFFK